ncbi:uncharacterized protein GGS22DRAFT_188776 [Annulohypoxylon maeteangense]|uniref:uncharacterized protein n=1 Tax=Annulohypoxylon maeteangense TaxID=1927788 RepID=UPI002007E7CB|nr:uncharacterized protein GGS22DRAFT_188776 [Annulohypoxylon maeteangense]KAI0884567.1 hypothetical protein GGS22DRAFT_188776 [Annulohypoxylon maeteangense]
MATANTPQLIVSPFTPSQIALPQSVSGQRLISFLDPHVSAPNTSGHRLEEILSWDNDRLSNERGYTCWLFPVAFGSDLLDQQTIIYIRSQNAILRNFRASFTRMMFFYGFDVSWDQKDESRLVISYAQDNRDAFKRWLKDADHNHSRIARMLISLRVFCLEQEALTAYESFLTINGNFGSPVSNASLQLWTHSVNDSLFGISQGLLNYQPQFFVRRVSETNDTQQPT